MRGIGRAGATLRRLIGGGDEAVAPEVAARALDALEFVAFDTETTGLEPAHGDEIVQIAAVRIAPRGATVGEVFDELVDPGRAIPRGTTRIHGITDEMVAGRPRAGEVLARFHDFIGEAVLVAHNAAFDMAFLGRKEGAIGRRFENPVLDTLLLSAVLSPRERDHSLDAVAQRLKVTITDRHSALGDARAAAEVFLKLREIGRRRGMVTLGDALRLSRKARAFRRMQRRYRRAGFRTAGR